MPKIKTSEVEQKFIEGKLYGGKVKDKFYPLSHQYWVSVKNSPFKRKSGSTTYISIKDKSDQLQIWQQVITSDFLLSLIEKGIKINEELAIEAAIQNDVLKDDAVDIGKEMHDWLEKYIKFKLKKPGYTSIPDVPNIPEAITGVNGFLAWEKERDSVKYISSERRLYSIKHDHCGTLDLEAKIDGLHCLVDFKSSNGLYNSVRMQTADYVKMDEEEKGKKIYDGRWALRFSKYTEVEYMKRETRKKFIKEKIFYIKKKLGVIKEDKEYKEYAISPYVAFEAKFLDKNKGMIEDDFDAFLNCKALYEWDGRTNWFYNPEY